MPFKCMWKYRLLTDGEAAAAAGELLADAALGGGAVP